MKLKSTLVGFLVATGGFATAASIVTGNLAVEISDPAGNPVQATINLGYIDTTTADLTSAAGIAASFVSAGSFTAVYGGAYSGVWSGEGLNFTDALGIAGQNVFVFAEFNGAYGLFEDPGTQFLADAAIPNSNTFDVTSGGFGSYVVHVGSYNAGGGDVVADEFALVIPEPSAMLLGGLGMLGFLRRRR